MGVKMGKVERPKAQGLYRPEYEHDSCGMGFIAHLDGISSRDIVDDGLNILERLVHRGGTGAQEDTGDGAGILMAMPDKFLRLVCKQEGVDLPEAGEYAVGMLFAPRDVDECEKLMQISKDTIKDKGFNLLHIRKIPYSYFDAGPAARDCMPTFYQLFISGEGNFRINGGFEHKLYVLRRLLEQKIDFAGYKNYYFASLSSKTIVYKGMLHAWQLRKFFPDLNNDDMQTSICVVHSRFSTNTFPSWDRAQPCRLISHNGEINTLRGNKNWFKSRESVNDGGIFKNVRNAVIPVLDEDGSDSTAFDNCLEFLSLQGRPIAQVLLMMIPEAWSKAIDISPEMKAFYEYNANIMEPWDGPAAICFSDGVFAGAILDRNGLRPARFLETKDRRVVLASEAGVLDIPANQVVRKGRLGPGEMILIDTENGKIMLDHEVKQDYAQRYPYAQWLDEYRMLLSDIPQTPLKQKDITKAQLDTGLKAFGYTYEAINSIIVPMANDAKEPISAMGIDTPIAVLSKEYQPLYNYFKQLFAQVTNPPIDALREEIVTGTEVFVGHSGNFTHDIAQNCKKLRLQTPIIDDEQFSKILSLNEEGFKTEILEMLYDVDRGGEGLEAAMNNLFMNAQTAIENGATILVLSDRYYNKAKAGIPALLAVSGLHHFLIRQGLRGNADIVLSSAEPYEVHHFATLVGYGVSAIHPYLAYSVVKDCIDKKFINQSADEAVYNYIKAIVNGIVKIMSKMGISAIAGYQGSQVFEALGISQKVIDRYFTGTASRIEGLQITHIADETKRRHNTAYNSRRSDPLKSGGQFQYKADGEYHMYNPETIHLFQQAVRNGDYALYKQYYEKLQGENVQASTLRALFDFKIDKSNKVPIEEVEPTQRIVTRFKTGAMSYGSISEEAHECIAIALNRLKGKSNSGEGGENPKRFKMNENGDSSSSAIKQVASGRFGVTAQYLASAKEIQIKMAQGAKPGEGGHLPGHKVYPWIAAVRNSTPGVSLISPPPHHDIYSIEDLAQLIYDLKNANPAARINVKLVSEIGVGTIAVGVAKGRADIILISGYDGGTGASPRTSIHHAGLPWELGVSETHHTLHMNGLRDRVMLETDGKMMSGRDVAIAALLGAEEYGFATLPLVSLGCIMMRVCNLNTCPVGIATQNPQLRKFFSGKPEYVENCLNFIAMHLREIMADLGCRSLDEMIGRSDLLVQKIGLKGKAASVDLSAILYYPQKLTKKHMAPLAGADEWDHYFAAIEALVETGQKVEINMTIQNTDRSTGTRLGAWLAKRYGNYGIEKDSILYKFEGTAGQSFGAFIPQGISLELSGDANDFVAKGICGGKVVIYPPKDATYTANENTIIGNVACYGATDGEVYIRGLAGERFCVRNSGVSAVVEGIGDHGCEYMTGGTAVILGPVGYNFAAGMSGGTAYVYDEKGDFKEHCNMEMITLLKVHDNLEQIKLHQLIKNHRLYTDSVVADRIIGDWDKSIKKFVKVLPIDYKEMLDEIKKAKSEGLEGTEMLTAAFERKVAIK